MAGEEPGRDGLLDFSSTLVAEWLALREQSPTASTAIQLAESLSTSGPEHASDADVLEIHIPTEHLHVTGVAHLRISGAADVVTSTSGLAVGFLVEGPRTDEGLLVTVITPVWRRLFDALATNPADLFSLDPREMEELVAAAWKADGWNVTLTPRSGDRGRDVIARRDDFGSIRILDQVKRYRAGRLVSADEVRAMVGVLNMDQGASKAYVTTTSGFAPGVQDEFARLMPTRLELRDGPAMRQWLKRIAGKPN